MLESTWLDDQRRRGNSSEMLRREPGLSAKARVPPDGEPMLACDACEAIACENDRVTRRTVGEDFGT